ncbi:MAG TPA: YceI family protein [Pyrinomonadaceae bacterium]|nr:YceI family protein [Pyrinomonadaceae bacterium]
MKLFKWLFVIVGAYIVAFASLYTIGRRSVSTQDAALTLAPVEAKAAVLSPSASRYQLDASSSKFMAHASRSGFLWFEGHGHHIAVREFTGEAALDPDSLGNSSLTIAAKTASMEETSDVFTAPQKQIINKELHDIVLLPDQYPEITFNSTQVTGSSTGQGQYDLKIHGNLTLLGVTKPITIPTKVTVNGNQMRAQGEFSISRGDFKVKATSAFHGMVRVADKIHFEFDIVGRQL